ncbi:hypothetical protein [Sphingomonas sp.]|uniref:hypothetical protein n=1 Tax=Sphingomonas sp. TaxID=28214 RepID=UPI003AFF7700
MLLELATTYHDLASKLLNWTGMSDRAMHVHVGLGLYVLAQLALRPRRGSFDALVPVIAAELANEAVDRLYFGAWRWDDTLGDIAATLAWPLVLMLVGRVRRWRWAARRNETGERLLREVGGRHLRLVHRPQLEAAPATEESYPQMVAAG